MRVLIDISEDDRASVRSLKQFDGRTVFITGDHLVHAKVIAEADPVSVTGTGGRGRAIYDITLLEDM